MTDQHVEKASVRIGYLRVEVQAVQLCKIVSSKKRYRTELKDSLIIKFPRRDPALLVIITSFEDRS